MTQRAELAVTDPGVRVNMALKLQTPPTYTADAPAHEAVMIAPVEAHRLPENALGFGVVNSAVFSKSALSPFV